MAPVVSVIMANWNGAAFLRAAAEAVLSQQGVTVELVVADDGSTDGSREILRTLAAADARVRPVELPGNGGPSAARNAGLDLARGEWLAVVDSDDLIAPGRLSRLIGAATDAGADAAADDLVYFGDPLTEGRRLMQGYARPAPWLLEAAEFARAHVAAEGLPPLGYLKPLFRRSALGGLRYDPEVRIGEDSDLLLRFLLGGGRMILVPEALYRYRRHPGSISHRWTVADLEATIAAVARLATRESAGQPDVARHLVARLAELDRQLAFQHLVDALKQGRLPAAAGRLARTPALAGMLAAAAREGLARRLRAARSKG
jgi:succinoglycan biosynthesis protein ExoO